MLQVGKLGKEQKENSLYYPCNFSASFKLLQNKVNYWQWRANTWGSANSEKGRDLYLQTCKPSLSLGMADAYLSSLITSTKWASVFSRMFLNLSGRRADWSKLTPAHLPFSCKISHREVWLLVSFSSWGGLRSPFWVLELGAPGACLKTRGVGGRHRGWSAGMSQCYSIPASTTPALPHDWPASSHLCSDLTLDLSTHPLLPTPAILSNCTSRGRGSQEGDIVGRTSKEVERRPRKSWGSRSLPTAESALQRAVGEAAGVGGGAGVVDTVWYGDWSEGGRRITDAGLPGESAFISCIRRAPGLVLVLPSSAVLTLSLGETSVAVSSLPVLTPSLSSWHISVPAEPPRVPACACSVPCSGPTDLPWLQQSTSWSSECLRRQACDYSTSQEWVLTLQPDLTGLVKTQRTRRYGMVSPTGNYSQEWEADKTGMSPRVDAPGEELTERTAMSLLPWCCFYAPLDSRFGPLLLLHQLPIWGRTWFCTKGRSTRKTHVVGTHPESTATTCNPIKSIRCNWLWHRMVLTKWKAYWATWAWIKNKLAKWKTETRPHRLVREHSGQRYP